MKKYIILLFLFLKPLISMACSTCNVEYTPEEWRGFVMATVLLITIPVFLGFLLYRYLKNHY